MKRSYWEKIATDYDAEIFDVLENDKKGIIRSAIEKLGAPSKSAIDAGCAIGKWLPVLSPAFGRVYAVDISSKNLEIAKGNFPQLKNIRYRRTDLSGPNARLPKCDLAICVNAILTASQKNRNLFFRNLSSAVKTKGHLILVVPSLESSLLTNIIARRWKIDGKILRTKHHPKEALKRWNNLLQGNVAIDGVPTKHYLREEISLLLTQEGFEVERYEKIEYEWNTEFLAPPKWLKKPQPWDWLCVAKKTSRKPLIQNQSR